MKALFLMTLVGVCLGCPNGARAQAPFRNLDFELAIAPPEPAGNIPIGDALPGWQGSAATLGIYGVSYNSRFLDSPQIGLYDKKSAFRPLFGDFSAFLMADFIGWTTDTKAQLFQTGFIPEESTSLRFATTREPLGKGTGLTPEDWSLSLIINGNAVPYVQVEQTSRYVLWAADISSFAGLTAEVRFSLDTTWPPWAQDPGIALGLDGIEFSPTAIPEPALIHLLLLGFGVAYLNNTRRRHSMITAHADLELRSDNPNPRAYCAHVERCKNDSL